MPYNKSFLKQLNCCSYVLKNIISTQHNDFCFFDTQFVKHLLNLDSDKRPFYYILKPSFFIFRVTATFLPFFQCLFHFCFSSKQFYARTLEHISKVLPNELPNFKQYCTFSESMNIIDMYLKLINFKRIQHFNIKCVNLPSFLVYTLI